MSLWKFCVIKTSVHSGIVYPPVIQLEPLSVSVLQELELRWQEYYELVTMLLQWIRHHILVFEERKFPTSYEEIEVSGSGPFDQHNGRIIMRMKLIINVFIPFLVCRFFGVSF